MKKSYLLIVLLIISVVGNGFLLFERFDSIGKNVNDSNVESSDDIIVDDNENENLNSEQDIEKKEDPNNESFYTFYQSFNNDKNFQKKRIKMPLEGSYYQDYDTEIKWDKEIWSKYGDFGNIDDIKPKDFAKEIEMWVYVPNSGYQFRNTFKMIDGKWYLVKSKASSL